MRSIIDVNLPITKVTVLKKEAIDYFTKFNDLSKVKLLKFISKSYVHLYKMGNMYNMIFSKMPAETSCLNEFSLTYYHDDELMKLLMPDYEYKN